jgi:tetratricopeptide (TPR) repeat protein
MLRPLLLTAVLLSLAFALPASAQTTFSAGDMKMTLDPENTWLPSSVTWKGVELLDPKMGVNHFFTSFEFRNKFYRVENRNAWAGQKDPRFVTDVGPATTAPLTGALTGLAAQYENSYAKIERAMTICDNDKERAFRVYYAITAKRDVVIHETDMFGASALLNSAFTRRNVYDAREAEGGALTVEGKGASEVTADLLSGSCASFVAPEVKIGVIATTAGTWSGGIAGPTMAVIKAGQKIELLLTLRCVDAESAGLTQEVLAFGKALPPEVRAYALVRTARALIALKKTPEAEAALLKAADLNREYAAPYGILAGLRRDSKAPGDVQTEAWVEGAYRSPYNYGYILSGLGFWKDKRLTEEQRRLAVFNVLAAVENTQFYADYYIWAARPFEEMKMHAQACAMYRQALWAVERLPRTEEHKEKFRKQFRDKIAELEKKLTEENYTAMPPMMPVRVGR